MYGSPSEISHIIINSVHNLQQASFTLLLEKKKVNVPYTVDFIIQRQAVLQDELQVNILIISALERCRRYVREQ